MEKKPQDQPQQESTEFSSLSTMADNKVVRSLVFAGAGLTALATASGTAWKEFYKEVCEHEPFRTMRSTRKAETSRVRAEIDAKVKRLPEGEGQDIIKAGVERIKTIEKNYSNDFNSALRRQGIRTDRIGGSFDRFKTLGAFDRMDIMMTAGASLAVTLGGYFLLNQSVRMKANNEQQDNNIRVLSARIDQAEQRRNEQYDRGQSFAERSQHAEKGAGAER